MKPVIPPIPEWFMKLMGGVSVSYPAWKCTRETIAVYWAHLYDLDKDEMSRAISLHLATEKFAPAIAEIRRAAQGPDMSSTYVEAWDEMRRNRKLYSPYASQEQNEARCRWSSEKSRRAAEAVGWTNLNWLESELPTIRAQHRMAYESLQRKVAEIEKHQSIDHLIGQMKGSLRLRGNEALYGKNYVDEAVPEDDREPVGEDDL